MEQSLSKSKLQWITHAKNNIGSCSYLCSGKTSKKRFENLSRVQSYSQIWTKALWRSNHLNKKWRTSEQNWTKNKITSRCCESYFARTVSICSLYISPHDQIEQDKPEDLIKYLSKPFIFLGDFNSHNTIWGSKILLNVHIIQPYDWTMSTMNS